jgi:HK97 family phage major capsid protein
MDEKMLAELQETMKTAFDATLEEKLKNVVGPMAAAAAKATVEKMRADRNVFGKDASGLSDEQKKTFAVSVKDMVFSGKALNPDVDSEGGFLLPTETADAILRVAASVGLVVSQATKWNVSTGGKDVPNYTGGALEGQWLDYDQEGTDTNIAFGSAKLEPKRWQLSFAVSKALLRDADVNLADWLLALAAEAMNNALDKQVFNGTGAPFVGILQSDDVTITTLGSGDTDFSDFDVLADASTLIGGIAESLLPRCAFYMHRTVWASLRAQTSSNIPLLSYGGAASASILAHNPTGGAVKPMGEILGFPVFTTPHCPALSATAVSTKFLIFGDMSQVAIGKAADMTLEQHRSGTFGSKEVAKSGQVGMVFEAEMAAVIGLAEAFNVSRTAAS